MEKRDFVLCFILGIILAQGVSAFGIASSYWDGKPLKLGVGESTVFDFRLQNMAGAEGDLLLRAELTGGTEIAKIIDESNDYMVPFGTSDTKVNVAVEIPDDAKVGDTYTISLGLTQIAEQDGGMVAVSGAISTNIPVEVTGEEALLEPEIKERTRFAKVLFGTLATMFILVAIALIIVIFFYYRKNKNEGEIYSA